MNIIKLHLIFALLFSVPSFATSVWCSGSPWFTTEMAIHSLTLPSEFLLNRPSVGFRNPTSEPLIVLVNGKNYEKIQENIVYEWVNGQWTKSEYVILDESMMTRKKFQLTEIQVNESNISSFGVPKETVEKINQNRKYGPGRPPQAKAPAPINFEISVQFKERFHIVKGNYSYAINVNYNSGLKARKGYCH